MNEKNTNIGTSNDERLVSEAPKILESVPDKPKNIKKKRPVVRDKSPDKSNKNNNKVLLRLRLREDNVELLNNICEKHGITQAMCIAILIWRNAQGGDAKGFETIVDNIKNFT
jgi:hypothetical protein